MFNGTVIALPYCEASVKRHVVITITLLTLGSAFASAAIERKARHYGKSLVKRDAVAGVVGSAAMGQAANAPHEWGRGAAGFGKRLGSGAAHYVVKDAIERGVGGLLHEERTNYVRADKPGFGPKFKSAAENTFLVRHKNSNKRYPAVGRLSGDFGSGLISRLWQPARLHTVASGIASGGISLGAEFGWSLAREYMPPPKPKRVTSHSHRSRQRYTRIG